MPAKTKNETKWTKQADGSYVLGEFTIRKSTDNHRWPWVLTHPQLMHTGGFRTDFAGHAFETLTKAKAGGPLMLQNKLDKIRTGIAKERRERAIELCKQLRITDAKEYSPAMGIGWFQYLEIKMGVTAAAIQAECAKARTEEIVAGLEGVDPDSLVAALQDHGYLDDYEPASRSQTVFQSGKATIMVEEFETGYRVCLIVGFDTYKTGIFEFETKSPDKLGNAAVAGINRLDNSDRERLYEDAALAFAEAPEDGYCPIHGERFKYTIYDSNALTIDAELVIGTPRTAEQNARIAANIAKMQSVA